jgi:hypothetical protein
VLDRTLKPGVFLTALVCIGACSPDTEQPEIGVEAAPPPADSAEQAVTSSRSPSPEGALVQFLSPRNGAIVTSPVHVEFSITGMDLVPAGNNAANSGHHHILIDTGLPDMTLPVPVDAQHVHFGDARSATELTLSPGEHTLQLLFADYLHVPHDPPVYSERITITVE